MASRTMNTNNFLLRTITLADNIEIAASQYGESGFVDISYPGYKAVAVAGWKIANASSGGAYSSICSIYECELIPANQTLQMRAHNYYSKTAKVKFEVTILYVKSPVIIG